MKNRRYATRRHRKLGVFASETAVVECDSISSWILIRLLPVLPAYRRTDKTDRQMCSHTASILGPLDWTGLASTTFQSSQEPCLHDTHSNAPSLPSPLLCRARTPPHAAGQEEGISLRSAEGGTRGRTRWMSIQFKAWESCIEE